MSDEINLLAQVTPHPPPKPRKSLDMRFWVDFGCGILVGICLIVGAAIVFAVYMIHKRDATPTIARKVTTALPVPDIPKAQRADYGFQLEDLDGKPFDAQSLRGKVVFLNYWATWCAPCRAEMPAIQKLWEKTKGEGVVFLLVSNEKREKIATFIKQNGYTFPVYREAGTKPKIYESRGIPTTFILSPSGQIELRHVGGAQWDHETIVAYLKGFKN